jgi:hypothetical protein
MTAQSVVFSFEGVGAVGEVGAPVGVIGAPVVDGEAVVVVLVVGLGVGTGVGFGVGFGPGVHVMIQLPLPLHLSASCWREHSSGSVLGTVIVLTTLQSAAPSLDTHSPVVEGTQSGS